MKTVAYLKKYFPNIIDEISMFNTGFEKTFIVGKFLKSMISAFSHSIGDVFLIVRVDNVGSTSIVATIENTKSKMRYNMRGDRKEGGKYWWQMFRFATKKEIRDAISKEAKLKKKRPMFTNGSMASSTVDTSSNAGHF